MPDLFDWRAYSRGQGIPPMHAWIACLHAFRTGYPHGHQVTSPASLDLICADPDMAVIVRATIDDMKGTA